MNATIDQTKTDDAEPAVRSPGAPETITTDDEIWTADDIHELIKSRNTYAIWKREGDERITELESLLDEWATWHARVNGTNGYSDDSLPVRTNKRLAERYQFSR